MVEIDPLLAFQFTVDLERSQYHCASLSNPPTLEELLHLCLPLGQPNESITAVPGPQSILLNSAASMSCHSGLV